MKTDIFILWDLPEKSLLRGFVPAMLAPYEVKDGHE